MSSVTIRSLVHLGAHPSIILKHPGPDGSPRHGNGTDQSVHGGKASLQRVDQLIREVQQTEDLGRAQEIRDWAWKQIGDWQQRMSRHESISGSAIHRLTNLYYSADNQVFDLEEKAPKLESPPIDPALDPDAHWHEITPFGPMVANIERWRAREAQKEALVKRLAKRRRSLGHDR